MRTPTGRGGGGGGEEEEEGCGSRRGEFDMLMQENAVRRRKRGGGEFEGRQGGIIRKMTLAPDEAARPGPARSVCPGLGNKSVHVILHFCLCEDWFSLLDLERTTI